MKNGPSRDRQIQRVILIEGAANILILTGNLVVGISTGSLAVLGDAIHFLTDAANNAVAWVVVRLSSQPADRKHPYGHRKFETLAMFDPFQTSNRRSNRASCACGYFGGVAKLKIATVIREPNENHVNSRIYTCITVAHAGIGSAYEGRI